MTRWRGKAPAFLLGASLLVLSCDRPKEREAAAPAVAATNALTPPDAPVGIYVAPIAIQELALNADGTYEARADLGTQSGTWKWDSEGKEFWLERKAGEMPYALRRLRVDRDDTNFLQWIPVPNSPDEGAIDYIRFARKGAQSSSSAR